MSLVNLRPYFLSLACLGLVWFVVANALWYGPLLLVVALPGVWYGWRQPMRPRSSAEQRKLVSIGVILGTVISPILARTLPQPMLIGVLVTLGALALPYLLVVSLRARRRAETSQTRA